MQRWKNVILLALATIAVLALSFVYSRKLGDELLRQAEVDELERIPVQEQV